MIYILFEEVFYLCFILKVQYVTNKKTKSVNK